MNARTGVASALGLLCVLAAAARCEEGGGYRINRISGPFVYRNLAIYFPHGADKVPAGKFMTLQEALTSKVAVVHEIGNVNELTIQNVSSNAIYIQAGEIVRGGKQDWTISIDVILPPMSGKQPLVALCVEQGLGSGYYAGRQMWLQEARDVEAKRLYRQHEEYVDSLRRMAQRGQYLTPEEEVARAAIWAGRFGAAGLPPPPTPMLSQIQEQRAQQLREEQRYQEVRVREAAADQYVTALMHLATQHAGATGFVVAVNGELNCADLYASSALFRKLWPKLLKAAAVEAVAELERFRGQPPPAIQAVAKWLASTPQAPSKEEDVNRLTRSRTLETADEYRKTTIERTSGQPLHINYQKK